jgi:FkbM family methyltransferase
LRWRFHRARQSIANSANVIERRAYLLREVRRRPSAARYTLTESGLTVVLRHHTDDTAILGEIFTDGYYELPAGVTSQLRALGASAKLVDLGAHIGLFGLWMAGRLPQARLTAFEPDPANLAQLRQVMALNDVAARWSLIDACAGNYDGATGFAAVGASTSAMAAPGDGDANVRARVVDVFAHLGDADVVKIDIEGGEWAILLDPRWTEVPARVVLMEYHPRLCPRDDARGLAIETLERAGFDVDVVVQLDEGHGMLRAIRR